MAVTLPTQLGGAIVPEYAASQSNITRQIQTVGGEIIGVFSASIGYLRTDFLVDKSGKKTAVVQSEIGGAADPARYGQVYLDPAAFTAALAADPALAVAFAKVADFEDSLIHADLVARNLI